MISKNRWFVLFWFLGTNLIFAQDLPSIYDHKEIASFFKQQAMFQEQSVKCDASYSVTAPISAAFKDLMCNATKIEITQLVEGDHLISKMYALNALRNHSPDVFLTYALPLLVNHATFPQYLGRDWLDSRTVSQTVFNWIHAAHKPRPSCFGQPVSLKVSEAQERAIIQLLIKDLVAKAQDGSLHEIHPSVTQNFFRYWPIGENYSEEVLFLSKQGVDAALFPLVRWKHNAHIPLIQERLEIGNHEIVLTAIRQWPHPRFATAIDQIFADLTLWHEKWGVAIALYDLAYEYPPELTRKWFESVLDRAPLIPKKIKTHVAYMRNMYRLGGQHRIKAHADLMTDLKQYEKALFVSEKNPRIAF